MRILVIGANGSTGRKIVRILNEGPHDPVAMVRDTEQKDRFEASGVPVVIGDLEAPMDPVLMASNPDAVIFAAGSGSKTGPEKTLAVDRDGAIRTMVAMEAVGVGRYIMLSSIAADPASQGSPISQYRRAKGIADDYLRRSPLAYTIVRPGRLTDDPGAGRVSLASVLQTSGSISREDVAAVLVACLDRPNTERTSFDLLSGETPIDDALAGIR